MSSSTALSLTIEGRPQMSFEDFVAYFEAHGLSLKRALALATLAIEAEGVEDAP